MPVLARFWYCLICCMPSVQKLKEKHLRWRSNGLLYEHQDLYARRVYTLYITFEAFLFEWWISMSQELLWLVDIIIVIALGYVRFICTNEVLYAWFYKYIYATWKMGQSQTDTSAWAPQAMVTERKRAGMHQLVFTKPQAGAQGSKKSGPTVQARLAKYASLAYKQYFFN